MNRDLGRLAAKTFDLLVIGGGIHGLFAALDAASRGLSVALVERDDFGSGLSFNHQRTIHGGLRALETGQVIKVRQQIAERRHWATIAPALLRPLPFLAPIRKGDRPSRFVLSAGLHVYNALGHGQNASLPRMLHLPASRVLTAAAARALCPDLDHDGLLGSAIWFDYQTLYPERLNWLVALAAERAGACLLNHAEAVSAIRTPSRFSGARVRDCLGSDAVDVHARATLIAAGSNLSTLFTAFGLDDEPPPLVAAANILVNRPASGHAIAARGTSGRRLTAVPWGGFTLVGTFQSSSVSRPDEAFPIDAHTMLAEANAAFPWLAVSEGDVRLLHRGLVPARVAASVDLLPEPVLIRHRLRGVPGVVSLAGVKFTTARLAAREAVNAALEDTNIAASASTAPSALPHASLVEAAPETTALADRLGLDAEVTGHLVRWYGTEADAVLAHAERTTLTQRLADASPVIEAEITYAVEHAGARRLADAVLRRTWLGARGNPGRAALERASELMGTILGWSDTDRLAEIDAVLERYRV